LVLRIAVAVTTAIGCDLIPGCSSAQTRGPSVQANIGPVANVRVPLKAYGLPDSFFEPGFDTKCASQIIGYRFVVWLDNKDVAVGFNTSPNCRQSSDRKVNGTLRILVLDLGGALKASRNLPYLADGNGELVADGEGMPGPNGTLLVRIESVNLDESGRRESPSGIRLLNADLKDVVQFDRFLEQTTLVDHAIVFQEGITYSGPRTYSILDGPGAGEVVRRQVDWPTGTMDRRFGEHGIAFMHCGQELSPGQYTSTNLVNAGARFRCSLNVLGESGNFWTKPLPDGETAALVGILADGSVVARANIKGSNAGRLEIWRKEGNSEVLPWLPPQFEGNVDTATRDFKRYASFATNDTQPCNPLKRILGTTCDEGGDGRWLVFDRTSETPLVNRKFPKNGRAALSPDGEHYASFEVNELRIYSIGASK
jgi:hypothetical protein